VRDPNDDMTIACALKARADYVVTRDKDLLSLGAHEGIGMVTPRQFLGGSGAG
jgi:predicted nucleic acid-binding protein